MADQQPAGTTEQDAPVVPAVTRADVAPVAPSAEVQQAPPPPPPPPAPDAPTAEKQESTEQDEAKAKVEGNPWNASTASTAVPQAVDKPKPADVGPDPSPERGYIGHAPGADDNAAHSQLTGVDAPELQPDDRTRAVQPAALDPTKES